MNLTKEEFIEKVIFSEYHSMVSTARCFIYKIDAIQINFKIEGIVMALKFQNIEIPEYLLSIGHRNTTLLEIITKLEKTIENDQLHCSFDDGRG